MNYTDNKTEMLEAIGLTQLQDEFCSEEIRLIEQGDETYSMISKIENLYELAQDSMSWMMGDKSTSELCLELDYA